MGPDLILNISNDIITKSPFQEDTRTKNKIRKYLYIISFLPLVLSRSSFEGLISVANRCNTPRAIKKYLPKRGTNNYF